MDLNNTLNDRGVLVAACYAHPVVVRPSSDEFTARLNALIADKKDQEFPANVKQAIRDLLKIGGFKPSGRNKPASEYLAQAAREDRFPKINNLVDINNFISLQTGLPITLLDSAEFDGEVKVRLGREEEKYVFNSAGQEIDLAGLICCCNATTDTPLGNPIKDSLAGKIKAETTSVVAIIYAPNAGELALTAKTAVELFGQLLAEEGGATHVECISR